MEWDRKPTQHGSLSLGLLSMEHGQVAWPILLVRSLNVIWPEGELVRDPRFWFHHPMRTN